LLISNFIQIFLISFYSKESNFDIADQVKFILHRISDQHVNWEKLWQEKKRALRQRIETIQVLNEKSKINRDLDLLLNEVEHRKRKIGETYEEAQANLANFQDICSNMAVSFIWEKYLRINMVKVKFANAC
jgi:hypothetical protein